MGRLKDGMLQGLRFDEENKKWLTKTWELKKAPRFKSSLEEARGKITDGDGLTLYLTPAGSMIWRVEYRWQKTRKSYTIGPYTGDESGVSLSEAREALVQVKKWLREGKDPSEQKRAANAPKEDVVTFAKVARDWYDQCTLERTEEYRKQIETRVKDVLIPAIGDIPIADLRGKDLLPLLREYEERGNCETAHKLAGHARQICQFASALGYCEFNAIAQLTGTLQPVRTQHRAAILEPAAIGELLRRIYEYRGRLSVRYALRIMPYVFLRSKELRSARWADIDLDNAVWRVPGESMKMNRDHVVPLATQVVAMFRTLRSLTPKGGEYVFASSRASKPYIGVDSPRQALRNMGYDKAQMCVHGFRSIASTLLREQGYPREVVEAQLSHKIEDQVEAAYNRAQYLERRREMMQAWADYLDSLLRAAGYAPAEQL